MDWLKSLAGNLWGLIEILIALALLAVVGIPLGNWFWAWVMTPNHAISLIAVALIALLAHHAHKA